MLYSVKNVVEGFEEIDYNDGVRTLFLYTDGEYGVVQTGYTTVRGNKIFSVPKYSREFYDKVLEIEIIDFLRPTVDTGRMRESVF